MKLTQSNEKTAEELAPALVIGTMSTRARHQAAAPYRPGADDHLSIPSLMGNLRKLPNGEVIE